MKLNIHYRGDVTLKDDSFDYIGGFEKKDMLIDPDLMTWSTFDDFCKENGVFGAVEQVWFKLPHEDISSARVIGSDKDSGIRELCREALIGGDGRSKAAGKGRGRGSAEAPKEPVFLMSPWADKVFVFGNLKLTRNESDDVLEDDVFDLVGS